MRLLWLGLGMTLLAGFMLYGVFWLETRHMEHISLEDRIQSLEMIMQRKNHPVIHIQNASVYTAEGEIVIEEK